MSTQKVHEAGLKEALQPWADQHPCGVPVMVCGNFILPKPAGSVPFYLRILFYLLNYCAAQRVPGCVHLARIADELKQAGHAASF